jgi:hypothetical protein
MARDLDDAFYEARAVVHFRSDAPAVALSMRAPGTAFVIAEERDGDYLLLYYEEPHDHTECNFADRVMRAHGRAWHDRDRRPSTHKLFAARREHIVRIGTYDAREGEITLIDGPDTRRQLIEWLGLADSEDPEKALDAAVRTTQSVKHETRRELRRALSDPTLRRHPFVRAFARRHGHGDLVGDPPTNH